MVAEIEFEAERYTRAEELKRGSAPSWTVKEAWARPLRNIVAYSLKDIDPASASITFDDLGEPVELPGLAVDFQEQQRSDEFVRQVRGAIEWLA